VAEELVAETGAEDFDLGVLSVYFWELFSLILD
jgi:hypothetical protein